MIDPEVIRKIHEESVQIVKSISQKGEAEMIARLVECYEKLGKIYAAKIELYGAVSEFKSGLDAIEDILTWRH